MCGLSGIYCYNQSPLSEQEADRFVNSLSHRGPNGRGLYCDCTEHLWLGHRRLTILDPSQKGGQPMSDTTGRFWITYNGEVYNFLELREELKHLGFHFVTDSDTEVVLNAFIHWGKECQQKFNGMWAFVIWDSKEKSLFFSRDRFGVKPLYLVDTGSCLAFASEIKAFLELPNFDLQLNPQKIADSLQWKNHLEASEETLFFGVKKLQAGYCAFFSRKSGFQKERWWDLQKMISAPPLTEEDQIAYLRDLLLDSCRLRLRSDAPLGFSLSGGLDSSSVVCMSTLCTTKPLSLLTASYPQTPQDELSFAQIVAHHVGVDPFIISVTPDLLIDQFDSMVFAMEDIVDPPIGPWMIYQACRHQGICVSIEGHGSDELFGGYLHHQRYKTLLGGLKEKGKTLLKRTSPSLWHALKRHPHLLISPSPYIAPSTDSFSQLLDADFHQRTLPSILRNFDRCSMAHGIEVREPFLDWRIVAFAFSLSDQMKIRGPETKYILREAMRGILPEAIRIRRDKIGFSTPLQKWLSVDLKTFALDHFRSRSFLESSIWDGKSILKQIEKAYATNSLSLIAELWDYLVAYRLMEGFKKSACIV